MLIKSSPQPYAPEQVSPSVLWFSLQDLPKGFVLGPLAGFYLPSNIAQHELQVSPTQLPFVSLLLGAWSPVFQCAHCSQGDTQVV